MNPKIGLALGSGGVRGFAHLGVLKVLNEYNIPIHCISGSSMGALIAALYANKLDLDLLEKLAIQLKRKYWIDLTVPKQGFITGEKIEKIVQLLTQNKNIEELMIPTAIIATDIEQGESIAFKKGPIYKAVRASIAIPGIFNPVMINNRLFIDGGVLQRVPVTAVKNMGADIILAVDVGKTSINSKVNNIFDVIMQTIEIMEHEIHLNKIIDADFIIQPNVGGYPTLSFNSIEKIISAGEEKTREDIDKIIKLISEWEINKNVI